MTESDAYPPIEAYGVVGNLETCALVGPDGSIDWFPFPHLESPSILAAILDAERGGRFRIRPTDSFETDRWYVGKTNVLENGYDEDVGAFVQSYGSDALDATGLLLPVVGFLPFDDERVRGTIEAIESALVDDDVFVLRYDGEDGLPGDEGAFVLCSCWLVDALALSGRVDEARSRFESLLSYLNPLGLVAEELDPETGTHLGNYPQAFSHIGIVNSALYLGYARGRETPGPAPMGIRLGEPISPPE
ncbi:glycoside hydrolase family 15 protein [Salinilacihabitans rarus]|uniref:glycoside hydrolase family 15 protein n=1 Tax=Salinilacihabitans rarus TaxID=2961596 RepID=UPI0020C8EF91|nr:glycoside hydrolase family 15 protein [Salinilacihabitans rarus]